MANEPKLEIYKIILDSKKKACHISFRDFFRETLDYSGINSPYSREDIFVTFYKDFVNKIDLKGYLTNEEKKKAFTISMDEVSNVKQSKISSPINANEIISGILEGGTYGRNRNVGIIDDTSKREKLHKNNVINDLFYFLLYTPLDHHIGILMVQGYTGIKISDVLREHLKEYFKLEKI